MTYKITGCVHRLGPRLGSWDRLVETFRILELENKETLEIDERLYEAIMSVTNKQHLLVFLTGSRRAPRIVAEKRCLELIKKEKQNEIKEQLLFD